MDITILGIKEVKSMISIVILVIFILSQLLIGVATAGELRTPFAILWGCYLIATAIILSMSS